MEFTIFGMEILGPLAKFVFLTSVLYILLPPVEVFKEFPRAQKYYGVLVAIVGYFALSARQKLMQLYPQYQNRFEVTMVLEKGSSEPPGVSDGNGDVTDGSQGGR